MMTSICGLMKDDPKIAIVPRLPSWIPRTEVFHVELLRDGQRHINRAVCPGYFGVDITGYFDMSVNEFTPERILSVRDGSKTASIGLNELTSLQARILWITLVFSGYFEFESIAWLFGRTNSATALCIQRSWRSLFDPLLPNTTFRRVFPQIDDRGFEIAATGWSLAWIAPHIDLRDSLLLGRCDSER